MKLFLIAFLLIATMTTRSRADEDDRPQKNPNAPKAIEGTDKEKGFKLSEVAIKRLGIKTISLNQVTRIEIPQEALLYHQNEVGIYFVKDGWFRLVDVEVKQKSGTKVVVESHFITKGTQIVIGGVPLLRVAELDAWGGTKDMD